MSSIRFLTITQQVARHLREEIQRGRWTERMPGKPCLAAELGVNHRTVEAALQQLERDGLLVAQGRGRSRGIAPRATDASPRPMRVGIFPWAAADRAMATNMDLEHRLIEAGHVVVYPGKSLMDLKMDANRVARMALKTNVDAWIVASASAEVLTWFAQQKTPALGLFGNWRGLPIAGVGFERAAAAEKSTKALLAMGHRRIVLIVRRQHREPRPAPCVEIFVNTLAAHGIHNLHFLLPNWEETVDGLQKCLTALFQVTPPTAIIADEPAHFAATYHFIAARGLRVPTDVSLIYEGDEPVFDWCVPIVAHLQMEVGQVIRHALRWADNVSQGKPNRRQIRVKAEFVPGGTVAPPHNEKPK